MGKLIDEIMTSIGDFITVVLLFLRLDIDGVYKFYFDKSETAEITAVKFKYYYFAYAVAIFFILGAYLAQVPAFISLSNSTGVILDAASKIKDNKSVIGISILFLVAISLVAHFMSSQKEHRDLLRNFAICTFTSQLIGFLLVMALSGFYALLGINPDHLNYWQAPILLITILLAMVLLYFILFGFPFAVIRMALVRGDINKKLKRRMVWLIFIPLTIAVGMIKLLR